MANTGLYRDNIPPPFTLTDICDFDIDTAALVVDGNLKDYKAYNWVENDNSQLKDSDWLTSKFMIGKDEIGDVLEDTQGLNIFSMNAYRSTAQWKWTNTGLGGSLAINPRPQFTRYCDIRTVGRYNQNGLNIQVEQSFKAGLANEQGLGRYYSEAIDDHQEVIYMQFGVPRFNSLISFFTRAISYEDATIANTGRYPAFYSIGKVAGTVVAFAAFPMITSLIMIGKLANSFLSGDNSFDYYYMEPTMHTYWSSVNILVTNIATELGLMTPMLQDDTKGDKIGYPIKISQDQLGILRTLYGDKIIKESGYIDVFAIVSNVQQMANKQRRVERQLMKEGKFNSERVLGYLTQPSSAGDTFLDQVDEFVSFERFFGGDNKGGKNLFDSDDPTGPFGDETYTKQQAEGDKANTESLNAAAAKQAAEQQNTSANVQNYASESGATLPKAKGDPSAKPQGAYVKDSQGYYPSSEKSNSDYWEAFGATLDSSLRGGTAYAIFNVDYTGPQSDSFSNSVSNIQAGDAAKSLAQGARNMKFNLSGGNIVGETVQNFMSGAKDVLAGALDGVTLGLSNVLQTLTGGAYIDVPKKWDDSDAQLASISYSIDLISPYGNIISQLQNIYIPLAMLLAATLPQKAGESSYTSPFLCSIFNKGKQNIKLGMITSLSIERGTSNLAFNRQNRPLAIRVNFTVTDFSNIMTTPISSSIWDSFFPTINESSLMGRYLSILGSRDLISDKYMIPKLKRQLNRAIQGVDQLLSPSQLATMAGESVIGRTFGAALHDLSIAESQMNN